jgi:hypothetical protein
MLGFAAYNATMLMGSTGHGIDGLPYQSSLLVRDTATRHLGIHGVRVERASKYST